jgi:uncharacterized protein YukJ
VPLDRYGVLIGRPIDRRLGAGNSPHYQIRIVDNTTDYRIAVNVLSKLSPSELEYLVDDQFHHPITERLRELRGSNDEGFGFHALSERTATGGGLDFIRGNPFDRTRMRPLPFNVPGPDNDLNDKIDRHIQRAMADETAVIYAFGQRWGPEPNKRDKYFGFEPGNGIHDIHMNQGNVGDFVRDDGVWQDGALLIEFPEQSQWVAIFLKFQSQTWHTDDVTGHQIGTLPVPGTPPPGEVPPTTEDPNGLIRIVAARVNAITSPEIETVTLLNTAPTDVSLDGWKLKDKRKNAHALSGTIKGGATLLVTIVAPMQLSNKGGIITLVDASDLKVDGVSYTTMQAGNPGWTIVF